MGKRKAHPASAHSPCHPKHRDTDKDRHAPANRRENTESNEGVCRSHKPTHPLAPARAKTGAAVEIIDRSLLRGCIEEATPCCTDVCDLIVMYAMVDWALAAPQSRNISLSSYEGTYVPLGNGAALHLTLSLSRELGVLLPFLP